VRRAWSPALVAQGSLWRLIFRTALLLPSLILTEASNRASSKSNYCSGGCSTKRAAMMSGFLRGPRRGKAPARDRGGGERSAVRSLRPYARPCPSAECGVTSHPRVARDAYVGRPLSRRWVAAVARTQLQPSTRSQAPELLIKPPKLKSVNLNTNLVFLLWRKLICLSNLLTSYLIPTPTLLSVPRHLLFVLLPNGSYTISKIDAPPKKTSR